MRRKRSQRPPQPSPFKQVPESPQLKESKGMRHRQPTLVAGPGAGVDDDDDENEIESIELVE